MRVVVVLRDFPTVSETFIVNQIIGLLDAGLDVRIVRSGQRPDKVIHQRIRERGLLDLVTDWGDVRDLLEADVLLCQFGEQGAMVARELERHRGAPPIVTCFRGYDVSFVLHKVPRYYEHLFAVGRLFLPVCGYLRDRLVDAGAPRSRTRVHHSGIRLEELTFAPRTAPAPHEPLNLISLGRLVEKKGTVTAIAALPEIRAAHPGATLTIVGDGPLRSALEDLTRATGLAEIVRFLGAVDAERVRDELDRAHCLVAPCQTGRNGNTEGIPNVLKEAMAAGVPVVSTTHAGIPELVEHGRTGVLVPPERAAELADAVIDLVARRELWPDMLVAARRKVEAEFDSDVLNAELVGMLREL